MILSLEDHKNRLDDFKKKRLASNLYASLESFETLASEGENVEMWTELRDYTKALIRELQIESETKGFVLL